MEQKPDVVYDSTNEENVSMERRKRRSDGGKAVEIKHG